MTCNEGPPRCGLFGAYPRLLQGLAHPGAFLVFYSLVGIMQGAYYTYLVGINNTLERRFAIRSQVSSVVNMADNISPIFFGAVIGHLSSRGHRPKWTSLAMFLSGVACIVGALPYLLYGPGNDYFDEQTNQYIDAPDDDFDYCTTSPSIDHSTTLDNNINNNDNDNNNNSSRCENGKKLTNMPSVMLIFVSNFLTGIVTTIYYSAGTAYLDDNVSRRKAPMYMTLSAFLRGLGPVIGFMMSSACLALYEDPQHPPDYDSEDPRWIGAWWIGFVILAGLQLLFTPPLLLFPKHIKQLPAETTTFHKSGILAALLRLIRNPIYMFHMFSQIFKWFGILGYFNYLPKYVQEQFRVSASSAALYGGSLPIGLSLLAALFGGVVIRYSKPYPRVLTFVMLLLEVGTVISILLLGSFKCEAPDYTVGSNEAISRADIISSCNRGCHCSLAVFHPVCIGRTTYFSPCFAGCDPGSMLNLTVLQQKGLTVSNSSSEAYENCRCAKYMMALNASEFSRTTENGRTMPLLAEEGRCEESSPSCTRQYQLYIIMITLMYCVAFVAQTAHILIPIRCVDTRDKTFSLAIYQGATALFAFIPYPLVYSYLVDSTCILWEESCSSLGNCWVYDIRRFSRILHETTALFCGVGAVCFTFVFLFSGCPQLDNFYADDNGENGDDDDEGVCRQPPAGESYVRKRSSVTFGNGLITRITAGYSVD